MPSIPNWLRPVSTITTILLAAVLIAGVLAIPYHATRSPEGYDQPRLHLNTKNSTRFAGPDLAGVAAAVSQAVYPSVDADSRPRAVMVYSPDDWRSGLLATSLLRPLKAVLLPDSPDVAQEIQRLGAGRVILLNGAGQENGVVGESLNAEQLLQLRRSTGEPPRHAILVDPDDPGTALLAAPWAAFSGDLVLFDPGAAPQDLPLYALGDAHEVKNAKRISASDPAHTAVKFASFDDPENPLFGWGFNADSLTGYRAYILAPQADPALALLSANLAVRGKPGPLLWAGERALPGAVNNYLWTQRAAFWITPAEGPFHHFFILGAENKISFPAQGQADYAVEIGPYLGKGVGMSGIDLLAAAWVMLGIASAGWITFHQAKYLPIQNWVMSLAWPLLALLCGPFGILFYFLAYNRSILRHGGMVMWDRPLWLQGMVATASAVGFGATLMIVAGFVAFFFGVPLFPGRLPVLFLLGTPMILVMILNYIVAVLVSWFFFQTPMLARFYGQPYRQTLWKALPMVLVSMTAAALAMNPSMWWLMMSKIPMMPVEESILWFGVMFFTGFLAFLLAWPFNYVLVRLQRKPGLM